MQIHYFSSNHIVLPATVAAFSCVGCTLAFHDAGYHHYIVLAHATQKMSQIKRKPVSCYFQPKHCFVPAYSMRLHLSTQSAAVETKESDHLSFIKKKSKSGRDLRFSHFSTPQGTSMQLAVQVIRIQRLQELGDGNLEGFSKWLH